ncbi:MAG: DUF1772 domain-containing protein [Chloroflexota bacterium]|nr:DUF1772 domain-containing protein [Chloroflexota bacterium]
MSSNLLLAAGIVGCGTVAGVFFAFSGFVMPALARLPVPQGVAAMQAVNVTAVKPPLMIALFGTAVVCLMIAAEAVRGWGTPGAAPRLLAAFLYLLGVVGVTMVCNVPRNNALDVLDPQSTQAASYWPIFFREWVTWNSVRTVASGLAAVALLAAR